MNSYRVERNSDDGKFDYVVVVVTNGKYVRDVAGFNNREDANEYITFLNQRYGR